MKRRKAKRQLPLTGIPSYDTHIARFNMLKRAATAFSLVRTLQQTTPANARQKKYAFLKALSLMPPTVGTRAASAALRSYRVKVPKTRVTPEDVLTVPELLQFVKRSPKRWRLLWAMLIHTGARVNSILTMELKRCHPDKKNGVVLCYSIGKGGRLLDYEIPIKLFHAIRASYPGFRFLFENDGKRLAYSTVQKMASRLGKRILRKRVYCHLFRHSLATHLVESGVPLPDVSRSLHHASLMITAEIYVHVKPDRKRIRPVLARTRIMEALDAQTIRPQARGIRGDDITHLHGKDAQGPANPVPRPEEGSKGQHEGTTRTKAKHTG